MNAKRAAPAIVTLLGAALLNGVVYHSPAEAAQEGTAVPAPAPAAAAPYVSRPLQPGLAFDHSYCSPGLAVALSLTPFPVDFGNLYAENLAWGVAYTAVEVSLMAPMMWFAGSHMDHGRSNDRVWSDSERNTMVGLLAGYVAVKLVAGLHAGYAARGFNSANRAHAAAVLTPSSGGAVLGWRQTF